jgi:hypothetical protein
MAIQCEYCTGNEFRRSSVRTDDIRHLLMLRYPVRCLRCGQRQYVSLTVAALSRSSAMRQPRPQRQQRTSEERNWTEPAERMVLRSDKDEPPAL